MELLRQARALGHQVSSSAARVLGDSFAGTNGSGAFCETTRAVYGWWCLESTFKLDLYS